MSFLRGSLNHVWCTTSVLGKGATGAVYQGVNKETGEPVAVKTFNQMSYIRPNEVQVREFEVLEKVNHHNIVKLLAIEEEQQEKRGKVIVMELCTGGSLFNILDDPENTYGLEEKEFLLVLDHLSAGMKHLRDNNLVHRDLKPGNIMKFICDDGSIVYKLTDFGAARELQEGQQFNSLYGTEEYLHPDMYERAVLKKTHNKTFGATVDLWSIGVTLYHVATGNLPFRPFGGRKNQATMFKITTQKVSGVISGVQTTDRGPIEWSYELPQSCQLSGGLKKIVTPLLAGLLEADQQLIWSFDTFFKEVTNILSRKIMHIFFINRVESIEVFILPDEKYEHLENYIKEQTEIQTENQILLYEGSCFSESYGTDTRAEGFPKTNQEKPLCLFSKDNNNISTTNLQEIPIFPEFTTIISVDNDAAQGKIACGVGYVCKRRIENLALKTSLIKQSVQHFTQYIKTHWKELNLLSNHLKDLTNSYKLTAYSFHMSNLLIKTHNENDYSCELTEISENFLTETHPKVTKLYNKNVIENTLQLEWESSTRNVSYPVDTKAPARVKTLVERLRESWQHLVRDRATRSLNYNDEQFHCLERIKIKKTTERIKDILRNECLPAYNNLSELLGDWYKIAQTVYLQTMILKKDVETYTDKLENFTQNLSIYNVQYVEEMQTALDQTRNGSKSSNPIVKKNNRKLKRIINEAVKERNEIENIIKESFELNERFDQLIKNETEGPL